MKKRKIAPLGIYSRNCQDAFELLELSGSTKIEMEDSILGNARFVPLGQVSLGGADVLVHAGFKPMVGNPRRVARELFLADRLLASRPDRIDCLPLFTLRVRSGGEDLGILTEDYTEGGNVELREAKYNFPGIIQTLDGLPDGLCRDVYTALEGTVYAEALQHMNGWAGDREVMVDFDDVANPSPEELVPYELLADSIAIQLR